MAVIDIPQHLYDREINFSISCFWDGGFMVKLGDDLNGFLAEETVSTFDEALAWLELTADEHYPERFQNAPAVSSDYG
ncbi:MULTISPECIES: hypothetical protein [unclassified Bradyrhizobium]|uniref:hypothetical protein n=1 Tax=unclassified Bradyrhizobium TaxID=2631580 RepID=UPI0028E8EA44|nr:MULTISPECIES: hypothetical protein [unclassified Bradyrhizobium]